MNGYICFWEQRREEVYAATSYAAQELAATLFQKKTRKKVKSYQIATVLAELEGEQVVHSAAVL